MWDMRQLWIVFDGPSLSSQHSCPVLDHTGQPQLLLSVPQTYNIEVIAVVNDTVGTMMGCEPGDRPCEVGLVVGEHQAAWRDDGVGGKGGRYVRVPGGARPHWLSLPGMGTNACYMEEARHVTVLDEDRGRMCVSVEWGSFNDNEALGPVLTTFDHTLDQESLNPGAQR